MRCKVSHSVTILDLNASSSHRYYKGYCMLYIPCIIVHLPRVYKQTHTIVIQFKITFKNVEFLHVSEITGPTSDSTLYLSTTNTTNTSTRSSNLLTTMLATHIQSTRKNLTISSTCEKDQILFSNRFTQQKLMYSLMMVQKGPKQLDV